MAVEASGRILLTDGDLVRAMTPTGTLSTTAGFGQSIGLAVAISS